MDINLILDRIMDFYSWIYDTTGLPKWQLLTLALSVLFILLVIWSYQRKSAFRKINKLRVKQRRSDIIGTQLTGSYGIKKEQLSSTPQNDEEQQSWGQTTKDWRKLREKLMHLQHELSKYEKSEKSLKEEIAALKITNDKLESEIRKRTEIEDKFQRQNNEFTNSAFPKNNEQIDSNAPIPGAFAFLAIFIGCLGLFALAAFTAVQKTKEIGIRKILGASVSTVLLLLTKEFLKWILIANIIAWPIAYYFMNKWLQDFAYRIELSWWIFFLSGGIAFLVALLTVSYQAIKAATSNPVKSLRYE